MKKLTMALIILSLSLLAAGCGNKNAAAVNQNIKTLVDGFQNSMVTFYDIKNLQDSSILYNQVTDNLKKVEDGKKKLEQLSGLNETITDAKIKAELANFIDLGRERERLVVKYLDDMRQDLDYKYKNPDAEVDINNYVAQIPDSLLDLEYRSKQSSDRLQLLLKK